jgi:primosomal protein N' (replication factor Y)
MSARVAQVVLNVPLMKPLDYAVPEALDERAVPGVRVAVPFGRANRELVGYCVGRSSASERADLKPISDVLDATPLVDGHMLALTRWVSDYYRAGWGEVLEAAIPAGVRAGSVGRAETLVELAASPEECLAQLTRSPKQRRVVEVLAAAGEPLPLTDLLALAETTSEPVRSLVRAGFAAYVRRRLPGPSDRDLPAGGEKPLELNAEQRAAFDLIVGAVEPPRFEVVLLLGVTGSGKTEVYLQAIERVVAAGRQAVVLVPEISLTPQTIRRFAARLDRIAVLHSHLTGGERHEEWQQIRSGAAQVVIGARSAVFAPTPRLGLIVIDEEHESSFKQENAPRYHARDVAVVRAKMLGIPVVLGSATPTLETCQNATSGKYRLAELKQRILSRPMPPVHVVDLSDEIHQRKGWHALSRLLENAVAERLARKEQVLLFLNRRGFSTFIECTRCGYVLKCRRCDISLVYHRERNAALCHYCNLAVAAPASCPDCGFAGIKYFGAGTERIEDEVRRLFPEARIARMDSDVMRRRGEFRRILTAFRQGDLDLLIGTQMIAKGLDFPNVTLVGVINADVSLNLPDFRSAERTFQLVAQVAGRTGRGPKGGSVIVQTFNPDHFSITCAAAHDYRGFVERELVSRRELDYPPFGRLVRILVTGADPKKVLDRAEAIGRVLTEHLATAQGSVLGPAAAPVAELKGRHRWHLILKARSPQVVADLLRVAEDLLASTGGVQTAVDVDPLSML